MPRYHRPLDRSPEEWRALAGESIETARESFDRCGDDGFMSQAANRTHADIYRTCARLAEAGGKDTFPGLFRISDGVRVRAKLYAAPNDFAPWEGPRMVWMFVNEAGKPTGKFLPDTRTKRGKMFKEGFEVRDELAPAAVTIKAGPGGGMCAAFLASETVVRDDDGYPEDAIVIKNGGK